MAGGLGSGNGHQVGEFKSKTDYYAHRLITEKPKLKDGRTYTVRRDGYFIEVPSHRSMNGRYAVYCASDYPRLFGWEIPEPTIPKLPEVKGHMPIAQAIFLEVMHLLVEDKVITRKRAAARYSENLTKFSSWQQ